MKLNIAYPLNGTQGSIIVDDMLKLRCLYGKRINQEVDGKDILGDEFEGYVFRITGGTDNDGFPMVQSLNKEGRARLLLSKGNVGLNARRKGERRRKSVRGCIVGPDIGMLCLAIVEKGEKEIPNITDKEIPRRLGPKRASKIKKLFKLSQDDDVRRYVIRRLASTKTKQVKDKDGNPVMVKVQPENPGDEPTEKPLEITYENYKAPKIQRLITPKKIADRRRKMEARIKAKAASREAAQKYLELLKRRSSLTSRFDSQ